MKNIIIFAGQSNMEGLNIKIKKSGIPKKYLNPPPNVSLFLNKKFHHLLNNKKFGPEVGAAFKLHEKYPKKEFILLKCAKSGTNLYYDWNPDGISKGKEDTYRGPMYPKLIESLNTLKNNLEINNEDYKIIGFCWMQGERDSVFKFMADAYYENLTRFIIAIRKNIGIQDLKFIIGQINPRKIELESEKRIHKYKNNVINAQKKIQNSINNVEFIDTSDLPQTDNLHFNIAGQLELGRRFVGQIL